MAGGRIIYIMGFMGSGKTTAGRKLAAALDWQFIDLDRKIEEKAGKSIPEIFSQYGEEYFRKIESETLKTLEHNENIVVSTGGGTPCSSDNMDFMMKTGLTVYLRLTPGQLSSRLSESKGERPLIKNLPKDKLLSFIEEKLIVREPYYSKALIAVDGIDIDIKNLRSKIKMHFNV